MILAILACADADLGTSSASPVLDASWVADVAAHPDAFQAAVNRDRTGWTALHRNDWPSAWSAGPEAHARAGAELARMHRVLATLNAEAWEGIIDTWSRRGGLPAKSALAPFASLAGVKDLSALQAVGLPDGFGQPAGELSTWMLERTDNEVWGLEKRVRAGDAAAIEALRTRAAEPAWREPLGGAERRFYDPLIHETLAKAYAAGGEKADSERLFTGAIGPAGEEPTASLAALGIVLPTSDDADACRAVVAALDAQLDPWKAGMLAHAPEGAALLDELRLVDGMRSRLLTTLAVSSIDSARNACAAVYAQDSLDVSSARTVGPINHPTAFAVLALADLRTGRVREALDALLPLMAPFPETNGVREVTGDLAVLLGMDRIGDSREN